MRHWLRSYVLLLKWNVLRTRTFLPFLFIFQMIMSSGIVLGFSLLVPVHDRTTMLYLATGAPTIALIMVGLVLAPQLLSQQKLRGLFDYQRAMPVPRLAMLAADASIWVVVAIPGVVAALTVAMLRFDLDLAISPLVVPAALLVATVAVAIGYGIAYLVKPEITSVLTNVVIFVAFIFAPVNYPASRLPDWVASVHQFLPFQYMAQAMRETLDVPATGVPLLPFVVLAGWAIAGLTVTARIMTRRA